MIRIEVVLEVDIRKEPGSLTRGPNWTEWESEYTDFEVETEIELYWFRVLNQIILIPSSEWESVCTDFEV
jgi:hypothetical protein